MKTFKTLVSEVAEPKAGDEKAFKDKHIVTKVGHPVALDHQFTGEIPGTFKSKRRADLEAGEDAQVYEAMDPVNPKAVKKKFDDRKDKDIDNDGDVDSSDEYLHKRRKAISKTMKKEEAEELDEISKTKMGQYIKRAHSDKETQKKRANIFDKKGMDADKDKDMYNAFSKADRARKKAGNRTKFIGKAVDKLTKESVDLDEAPQPKWKVAIGKKHYTVTARNTAEADKKAKMLAKKDGNSGLPGEIKRMNEDAWEEIPMMMNSLRSMSHNISGISRYLQSTQDPEEWFQNKLAGVAKEMQTLYSYATAEVMAMGEETDLDEARQLKNPKTEIMVVDKAGKTIVIDKTKQKEYLTKGWMLAELDEAKKIISQKTITRALQGMKVKPKGEVSLKKAPWDKKEEADQIDEAVKFKAGMIKLKDGSSMIIKKQDADLLTQMFDDLSPANRKKMENVAMKDKAGFEEILGFAREAL